MYLTFVLYTECVPTINQDVDKEARKIDFQDFTLYEILFKTSLQRQHICQ